LLTHKLVLFVTPPLSGWDRRSSASPILKLKRQVCLPNKRWLVISWGWRKRNRNGEKGL